MAGLLGLFRTQVLRLFGWAAPGPGYILIVLIGVWAWAALTPVVLRISRSFPFERARWPRSLLVHGGFFVPFAFGDALLHFMLWSLWVPEWGIPFRWVFWGQLLTSFLCYSAVVVVDHALSYHRRSGERQLRASQLETQLLETRFAALEAQLRPHFLFNTLHSVAALLRTGQDAAAIRMIDGLGDLLRTALRREGAQEIPLREEMDFIARYLSIEHIRFQDRLQVSIDIAPGSEAALVPSLVLQPLVENAIRHGVEASEDACEVHVRALREGEELVLTVRDTGSAPVLDTPTLLQARGIGLANTRARLAHLHGDRARLELSKAPGGGALARVVLRFREASPDA